MVFDSVYEMFNPLTDVRKQHFWDWFSGKSIDSRWTYNNVDSSADSSAMSDTVDGGYELITGTPTAARCAINFNDKRQYSHSGSVIIGVIKGSTTSNMGTGIGLADGEDLALSGDMAWGGMETALETGSKFLIRTADGSSGSNTETNVSIDTNFHSNKIELDGSNAKYTLDGVLKVTKDTNLPDTKLQPTFYAIHRTTGGTVSGFIRYCEAYNT